MTKQKGLSQILWLIVAASVLMIAALSLVFMLQGGLEGLIDFGGQADASTCESQATALCQGAESGQEFETPSSCLIEDDQGDTHVVDGVSPSGVDNVDTDFVQCE